MIRPVRDFIIFYVNGKKHKVSGHNSFLTLASYLRYEQNLTGTKIVCNEGDCGACSVMGINLKETESEYRSFNSCLSYLFLLDGHSIITIDAMKCVNKVQEAMIERQGTQCGFCTPGFVVAMYSELSKKNCAKKLNYEQVQKNLQGNLCRCTGMRSIALAFMDVDPIELQSPNEFFNLDELRGDYLQATDPFGDFRVTDELERREFYAPKTISQVSKNLPEFKIMGGATDLCVQNNKRLGKVAKILSLQEFSQLKDITIEDDNIQIYSRVTLNQFEENVYLKQNYPEIIQFMERFASKQIKNMATLTGNIMNASPVADMVPFLMAIDAKVVLKGKLGIRTLPLHQLYLDYKMLNIDNEQGEWPIYIQIPKRSKKTILFLSKVSKRRDLDISIVNCAFSFSLNEQKDIQSVRIVYGGVGPFVYRLKKLEKYLVGRKLNKSLTNNKEIDEFLEEVAPISDHRGSSKYRKLLVFNLWKKFLYENA